MSGVTPLKTTNTFSSTSTASSNNSTPACSPTTSTSSNDSNALKFFDKTLDKVKAYVPHNHHHHHHHHHHQSKKTYSQPPTSIPQQHHRSRSTESLRSVQRRQTVAQYGRHSNEWLFGGVSVRRAVSGLFQQEN